MIDFMNKQLSATTVYTVTPEKTARAMGSGALEVLATPALIAMMEECACKATKSILEEGQTSVGTGLQMSHTAATPVGMQVTCTAVVTSHEGRKITFEITAEDEKSEIGKCIHERFVVYAERFTEKTYKKLEN